MATLAEDVLTDVTTYEYSCEVVRPEDGMTFGRRKVPSSHLESAREQLMFAAQRRGLLGLDTTGVIVDDQPVFVEEGSDRICGITMGVGRGARRVERSFDIKLLDPFASAITQQLLDAKQLDGQDRVTYRAYALPAKLALPTDGVSVRTIREPLRCTEGQLDDWLAAGRPEGTVSEDDYPLFVLDSVLERAEKLSSKDPSKEGGCWLIGNLLVSRQPKHEIFGVIHTAIEAHGVTHDRFGLSLSSETFLRLKDQLERRRKRFGRAAATEMAFYHTHPFLPSELLGHEACTQCSRRADCDLSSAFLSQTDARFHMAIFGRAAYAVEFVLGRTARDEPVLSLYSLDGGQFRARGFYRVTTPPSGAQKDMNWTGGVK